MCPPINHGASQWWCGDSGEAIPCQNVSVGHLVDFTGGPVLGFPPITSSASVEGSTTTSPQGSGATSSSRSSPGLVASPTSSQAPQQSSKTPIAIGAGIGAPLGLAAIGLLAFLFWRESRGTRAVNSRALPDVPNSRPRRLRELLGSEAAWEADHRPRTVEMAGVAR